jgi:hypothetical protein
MKVAREGPATIGNGGSAGSPASENLCLIVDDFGRPIRDIHLVDLDHEFRRHRRLMGRENPCKIREIVLGRAR